VDRRQLRSIVADRTARRATVLDDVELPGCRADADHVVVAPNGVWLVATTACAVDVEVREVGGFFREEQRLHIDGRDRTGALDGLVWQRAALDQLLDGDPADPTVRTALVLLDGERDVPVEPIHIDDHRVCSRRDLGELVAGDGPLTEADVARIVGRLRGLQDVRVAVDLTDPVRPAAPADAVRALLR
jgi:hypothetical protein